MAEVSATPPVEGQEQHPIDQQLVETTHDDSNNNDPNIANNGNAVTESHAPHEMSIKEYALTRFSSLRPPMHDAPNPFRLLMMLSGKQWLFFLVAFLAWVCAFASRFDIGDPPVFMLSEYIYMWLCTANLRRPGMPSTSSPSP
jgi:hypothetical protein